ncbi:unnamed protein product [Closterium sp. Yama58-4]|nr:unnamed protein product [Closterium sp. Yama58-4]
MAQRNSLSAFVEKYEVREDLGKGQFGVVAECVERNSGRRLACKVVAARRQAMDAAGREAVALSLLKGCENIVTLEDVFIGEEGKGMVLVMELATGGDLLTRIEQKGRIPESEARDLFKGVAMALKQCHDNGVIHRDVKPDNVLLFPAKSSPLGKIPSESASPTSVSPRLTLISDFRGRGCEFTAKLADFGIARVLAPGEKSEGYAGSFPYEAPEVMAGKPYDFSADIWSLGVTLYAMLSGKWPTFANGRRAFDEGKDWDSPCWWIISGRARNLIRSMLATDPQIRPSIDEVLSDPWVCNSSFLPSSFSISPSGSTTKPAASAPARTVTPAAAFTIKPSPADAVTPAAPPKTRLPATCDPSSTFIFPLATLTIKTTYKTTCSTVKSCKRLASDVLQRKQWRRHGAVTSKLSPCASKLSPCASKLSPCNSSLSRRHSSRSQRGSFSAASGRLSVRVAAVAVAAVAVAAVGEASADARDVQWSFMSV